jgi:hypothetical protein
VDTFMRASGDWAVKSPLTPKSRGDRIGATWVTTVKAGHAKDFDAAEPHWVPRLSMRVAFFPSWATKNLRRSRK